MKKFLSIIIVSSLLMVTCVWAEEIVVKKHKKILFELGLLGIWAASCQSLDDDLNMKKQQMEENITSINDYVRYEEMGTDGTGKGLSITLRYLLDKNYSVGIIIGVCGSYGNNFGYQLDVDGYGSIDDNLIYMSYLLDILYQAKTGLLNFYFGGGLGFYQTYVMRYIYWSSSTPPDEEYAFNGDNIGTHISAKIEYPIGSTLSIWISIKYRFLTIDKLKDNSKDKYLTNYLDNDYIPIEMDGYLANAGLGIRF